MNEDDDLFEKYNVIKDKVRGNIKKEFDSEHVNSKKKKNSKPKENLMVMKLQIFTMKKFLRWTLIILV